MVSYTCCSGHCWRPVPSVCDVAAVRFCSIRNCIWQHLQHHSLRARRTKEGHASPQAVEKGSHVQGDTQSFVVRIWHEAVDNSGQVIAWRGSIDHVGSEKRLYFQDLETIAQFIQNETGINQNAAPKGASAG